jgi:hypothetical protein
MACKKGGKSEPQEKGEWRQSHFTPTGIMKQEVRKQGNFSSYNPKQGHLPGPVNHNKQLRKADQNKM